MWQDVLFFVIWWFGVTTLGQTPPRFSEEFYSIRFPAYGEPTQYNLIECVDPDGDGGVSYDFVGLGLLNEMFSIDVNTGAIQRVQNISSTNTFVYEIRCMDIEHLNDTATIAINIYLPNLNPPVFSMPVYEFSIDENENQLSVVGMVSAVDQDGDDIDYELRGEDAVYFRVSGSDGTILSTIVFDRETRANYSMVVVAYDAVNTSERRSSNVTVNVRIDDVNDNQPRFVVDNSGSLPAILVNQNLSHNVHVSIVACTDNDVGVNSEVSYALLAGTNGQFSINPVTGIVTYVSGELSAGSVFSLLVQCTDGLGNDTQPLTITIVEENQHNPVLDHDDILMVSIDETAPLGSVVIDINATDMDEGQAGRIVYRLIDDSDVFAISQETGTVTVRDMLDYETEDMYNLTVAAENPEIFGTDVRSVSAIVQVMVININDHVPKFLQDNYTISVQETYVNDGDPNLYIIPPPHNFMNISCTDRDVGTQTITYSLNSSVFVVDPILGNISAIQNLDFENTTSYSLAAYCYDNGLPNGNNLTGTTLILITVLPVNEYRPVVEHDQTFVSIDETTQISTVILSFDPDTPGLLNYRATDADSGRDGDIYYFVGEDTESNLFSVDRDKGIYRLSGSLDVDNATTAIIFTRLHVVACDSQAVQRDCSIVVVRIIITKVNEHVPMFTMNPYHFSILESTSPSATSPVFNTSCTDDDEATHGTTTVTVLSGGSNAFRVDEVGRFFLLEVLDYESRVSYNYELMCSDGQFNSTTIVNVSVLPENDNAPRFVGSPFNFNVSVSTPVLSHIGRVTTIDADIDEGATLTFTLQTNGYFSIAQDGSIVLLTELDDPSAPVPPPEFSLRVDVTDGLTNLMTNVTILLTEGNYVAPVFGHYLLISTVSELAEIGHLIQTLTCYDNETGVNGEITYQISFGNDEGLFEVVSHSGDLIVAGNLVLPENDSAVDHVLTVECSDGGVPMYSATAQVIVCIEANIPLPVLAFVAENAELNHIVANISYTNNSCRSFYDITDGNEERRFAITSSGSIIVIDLLDRETTDQYHLQVVVSNCSSATHLNVSIFIRDVNDNAPVFVSSGLPVVVAGTPAGTTISTIVATDMDKGRNGDISFVMNVTNNNSDITVDYYLESISNGVAHLITNKTIDLDSNGTLFTITAIDNGPVGVYPTGIMVPTISLPLMVVSQDLYFRSLVYTGQLLRSSNVGEFVLQVFAMDGSNETVEYHILGDLSLHPFVIDLLEGTVTLQRQIVDPPSTRYEFYIEALNGASGSSRRSSAFVIIDLFEYRNLLDIHTCKTAEELNDAIKREQFRQGLAQLIKQGSSTGSLFVNEVINIEEGDRTITVVQVYMITADNFYQNWTSESYTSEARARELPKSFRQGTDIMEYLTVSLQDEGNRMLADELCIMKLQVPMVTGEDDATVWPQSPTGIAVITLAAFLLVTLVTVITSVLCVHLSKKKKKSRIVPIKHQLLY